MLKIKKIRQNGKWVKSLQDFVKDFLGSLAFMSWLVGGMKAGLCILNNLNLPLDSTHNFNLSPDNTLFIIGGISFDLLHPQIQKKRSQLLRPSSGTSIVLHIFEKKDPFTLNQWKNIMFRLDIWNC